MTSDPTSATPDERPVPPVPPRGAKLAKPVSLGADSLWADPSDVNDRLAHEQARQAELRERPPHW